MNLHDLIKRSDRHVAMVSGAVAVEQHRLDGQTMRCVRLKQGSVFKINRADGAFALKDQLLPPKWTLLNNGDGARGELIIRACEIGVGLPGEVVGVGDNRDSPVRSAESVSLDMEALARLSNGYDLQFQAIGGDVIIAVGPLVSERDRLLKTLVGKGVELGPGLNPAVLPSATVEVSYIEQTDPAEWAVLYNAEGADAGIPTHLRALYKIDSATSPAHLPLQSLDFVFSNHVCEHFPNFGQVLLNWSGLLKPGGTFCGVVPDCRYSFDYRQVPSSLEQIVEWERSGGFEIPDEYYDRWCAFTEPNHKPVKLKARGYSIHVNYFTPTNLAEIFSHYCARGVFKSFRISCHSNGRDIGFCVWR